MAATGGGEAYVSTQGTGRGAILSLVTPEPEIVPPLKRTVTIGRMVVLAFALTAMGPFGIEVCVGAAGPLYTLIALIGLPFVWAVPQALMTAELSTMIPENGGYILWVRDAYGPFLGWINAWNCTFSNLFDNAVYVVLFVAYLPYDLTPLEQWYIKAAVILVVMALNLRGLEAVTAVSVVLTMAVCAPFLIMFAARVSDVRPIQWLYLPSENHVIAFEDIDFGLFLSVALWAYTGWDSLGSFAGEVVDPYRTYPRGVAITLVINVLLYVLPILTGLTFSAKSSAWTDGYFTDVARMITPWLGAWVVVAAMISNLAQYNAAIACTSRALWSMGRPENRMLPSVVGFTWERYGTPAVAIVLLNLSSLVLVVFDFSVLIQVDTFLNCLTLMMEFASFLRFRYRDPDRARPFRVPGGMAGAWLITVPKVLVVGATLAMADSLTLLISAGINAFIIILYLVVYVCRRTCTCCSSEDGDGSGDGDIDRVRLLPR